MPTSSGNSRGAIVTTLAIWVSWAWIVMTVTHEVGHVIAGALGGAHLQELELRPWRLPHSIHIGDAHPRMTLWAGPLFGSALPLVVAKLVARPGCWFVGWFCLLANGMYLLLGLFSSDAELDSARLILAGAGRVEILVFAAISLTIGYIRFRRSVIDLIDGTTPSMSKRQAVASGAGLIAWLAIQSWIRID